MARPLTIALTGDVMLGRHMDEVIAERGTAYPWGNLAPVLNEADLLLVNLECALTSRNEASYNGGPKRFSFRTEPARGARALAEGGVDFASLANNHVGDFGSEGLIDTVTALDTARIAHAGAGINQAAARMPACLTAGGLRVSVVSVADYPAEWTATAESPGMNYLPVSTNASVMSIVKEALATAREESDLVIFSIHWGPNMRARPSRAFRSFAHRVIESGADLFWGHSAHVVHGIEVWKGKPILYDTGDFIDDYAVDPGLRNDRSALFLVRVSPPVIERIDVLPVEIADCQVNRATGPAYDWFTTRFKDRCRELGCTPLEFAGGLTISINLHQSSPSVSVQ